VLRATSTPAREARVRDPGPAAQGRLLFALTQHFPVSVGPANIDLEAGSSRHQNKLFPRRRLDRIGDRWFLHAGILAGDFVPRGCYTPVRIYCDTGMRPREIW
jgi:hypothetical protein